MPATPPALPTATQAAQQQDRSLAPEEAVAEALRGILRGYRFNKRLLAQSPQDNWLLFTRGANEVALVGWTEREGSESERLALTPASPMVFGLFRYTGEPIRQVQTVGTEIGMVLEQEPMVLLPSAPNGYLMLAASAQTVPAQMRVRGPQTVELTCEFQNPLNEIVMMPVPDMGKTFAAKPGGSITVRKEVKVGRSPEPIYTSIGAMGIRQPVKIIVENPLELSVRPEEPQVLMLDIFNPSGDAVDGYVLLHLANAGEPFRLPLQFRKGQHLNSVRIPLGTPLPLPVPMMVSVEQTVTDPMRRTYAVGQTGALQFVPAASFTPMNADGSPEAYRGQYSGGASALLRGGLPAGAGVPWPQYGALGLIYDLGSGTAQIDVVPTLDWATNVYENPSQIGFWLQGDGSGNLLSLVWEDAAGKQYASPERAINWRGWRYILLDVPAGAGVRYPLKWVSLLRLRGGADTSEDARRGALLANGFCFVYGDNFSLSGYRDESLDRYEQGVSAPAAPAEVTEETLRGSPLQRGDTIEQGESIHRAQPVPHGVPAHSDASAPRSSGRSGRR